jgi:hypothetical protein
MSSALITLLGIALWMKYILFLILNRFYRILLGKLIVTLLIKKFSAFNKTDSDREFIKVRPGPSPGSLDSSHHLQILTNKLTN